MTSRYVIGSAVAGCGSSGDRESCGADMQGNQRPRQGRPPRLPRQLRRGTAVELISVFSAVTSPCGFCYVFMKFGVNVR